MILFIALTSTFNLCVGYVLGVYFGELPGLPTLSLPRRKPVDPPEAAIDLTVDDSPKKGAKPEAAAAPPAPEPEPEPESQPAPAEPPAAEPVAKKKSESKPSHAEVISGLNAFQAQLAKMGSEMKAAADDETAFGECTDRLQKANSEYLEQAQTTIDELGEDPADTTAVECRGVIEESAKLVSETNEEIDSLLADGPPDEAARAELIAKTESLTDAVAEAEEKLEEVIEAPSGRSG